MAGTSVPRAKPPRETGAYGLAEVERMITTLPEPAASVVAVAAFTGLRKGEIQALRWGDFEGGELHVRRSCWKGNFSEPKTRKSKAPVPVIGELERRLEVHRAVSGDTAGDSSLIFRGGLAVVGKEAVETPLNLDYLAIEIIRPQLRSLGIEWKGWHAFRRGLATVLHSLGTPDVVIQRVLRHSNVGVTQACYIKTADGDVRGALDRLNSNLIATSA